jgi:hypothetical protein
VAELDENRSNRRRPVPAGALSRAFARRPTCRFRHLAGFDLPSRAKAHRTQAQHRARFSEYWKNGLESTKSREWHMRWNEPQSFQTKGLNENLAAYDAGNPGKSCASIVLNCV